MTIVVIALSVVVLLLSVLVAGLLRSHATILRRLHELGVGLERDPGTTASPQVPRTDGSVPPPRDVSDGRRAHDVVGVDPTGAAIGLRTVDVDHDTLLMFLSSGCTSCEAFWSELAGNGSIDGVRVVVVTRDLAEESTSAIRELAPEGVTVVASTGAWKDLEVPGSPYAVLVHGRSGRVVGEGTGASFTQVKELFLRSSHDHDGKARADQRRERELDRVLLDAGLGPGDPSLYRPPTEPR